MKPTALFNNGKVTIEIQLYSDKYFVRFSDGVFGATNEAAYTSPDILNRDPSSFVLLGKLVGFKTQNSFQNYCTSEKRYIPPKIRFEYLEIPKPSACSKG